MAGPHHDVTRAGGRPNRRQHGLDRLLAGPADDPVRPDQHRVKTATEVPEVLARYRMVSETPALAARMSVFNEGAERALWGSSCWKRESGPAQRVAGGRSDRASRRLASIPELYMRSATRCSRVPLSEVGYSPSAT